MKQSPDPSPNDQTDFQSLRYPRLDFSAMSSLPGQHEMDPDLAFDDTSDSSYEIISQDSFHNSDDESHDDCTDSMASLSDNNRDVVSAILNSDHSAAETETPNLASGSLESTVIEESLSTPSLSSTGFGLSPLPSEPFLELPPDWVNFKESTANLGNKNVEFFHTVQHGSRRQGQVVPIITVKQTMSKKLLKLDKPLHIVYCGNETAKHDIIEKVAGAVAASLRVSSGKRSPYSKLQIVPLSSFGHDYPNAQVTTLPSTGLEMFVSDCTGYLARGTPSGRPNEMYYEYCYPGSLKSGEDEEMQSKVLSITCRRPDLALVTHNGADPDSISWQQSHALARLDVPVIDINEIGFPQSNLKLASKTPPSTQGAVHMHLQFPKSYETLSSDVPIDLSTFLSIDPRQLNRNITYLSTLNDVTILQPRRFVAELTSTMWSYLSCWTAFVNRNAQWWNDCFERQIPGGLGPMDHWDFSSPKVFYALPIILTLCSMLMLAQYSALFGQPALISDRVIMNQTSLHARQTSATLGLITVTPTAISMGKTQKLALTGTQIPTTHTEYLVSTVTKTVQLPTVARLLPSDTLDFWLYKTKEGRLFLHSAKKLPKKWQPPKDWIEVSQGRNRTMAVFTKFNESTYELHVNADGTCDPLTVIVQPSKGQHAQKIFQLHDSNLCKPKRPWTVATHKLAAWRYAFPAQLQSTSVAIASKTKAVIGNAKSSFNQEASKIGSWTQTSFERCNTALRAGSSWIPTMMYKAPGPVSLPNVTEASPPLARKSFKSFKITAIALRDMKDRILRSANRVGQSTMTGYHNGVSSYQMVQHAIQSSFDGLRTQMDTFKKNVYCTSGTIGRNVSFGGMDVLDVMKYEFHHATKTLGAEMYEKYTAVTWWSKDAVRRLSDKMPHKPTSKPLKLARNRLIGISAKVQMLGLGTCQKVQDLVSRSKVQSPEPSKIDAKNVVPAKESKATWRRFLHLQ